MFLLLFSLTLGASPPPFPAPMKAFISEDLKYDTGTVSSVDTEHQKFKLTVPAGSATFQVEASTAFVGAKEAPDFSLATLKAGQHVRVYYRIKEGAKVAEVDLQ